jgi:hypothetical protein
MAKRSQRLIESYAENSLGIVVEDIHLSDILPACREHVKEMNVSVKPYAYR